MRTFRRLVFVVFVLAPAIVMAQVARADGPMILRDRFGRDLQQRGVRLLDWEGHIANPACRLTLELEPRVNIPARVVLRANGCRLMFDLFSEVGPDGPSKTLLFPGPSRRVDFLMAIFPDRDGSDETYELTAELTTGMGERRVMRWPIHVEDKDKPESPRFAIRVDYRHDQTGFFEDARPRRILEQAVADWAYFMDDQGFERVAAGTETAFIHDPTTFERGWNVTNPDTYTGFLLFAQGIRGPEKRSGGRASDGGGLQTRGGRPTGLRRSGTVISEITGNWNGLGWSMEESDDRWWVSSSHAREPHDYYSIVRHEIGHCLIYHRVHPAFARISRGGVIRDRAVERYLGKRPRVNASEHLFDTVDPISRVGAFGNEYGGDMPRKRWLMTKLDLLIMRAVGYKVREIGPLRALQVHSPGNVTATVGEQLGCSLEVEGGVPEYSFRVVGGKLPDGITLDSFTGRLVGVPTAAGRFNASVEISDSDPSQRPIRVRLNVTMQPGASHESATATHGRSR